MVKIKLLLLLLSVLMFFSCKAQTIELEGKWSHNYEKDSENLEVYVKGEGPELPPARFRQKFVFFKDGVCKYNQLGIDDRHGMKEGTYHLEQSKLTILNENEQILHKYEIISSQKESLVLKKL